MHEGPTRARPPSNLVRYAKACAVVTRGRDRGAQIETAGEPIRIGTALENDLILTDDSVSRYHCEITISPEGARVIDRGSTNGVIARGIRVYDALLPHEVLLQLGDSEISVTPMGEVVEREQILGDRFGNLLGRSARMRELFAVLHRLAAVDVSVLIEGETGSGKDVVAESIHHTSPRADGPFVVFDCGAVSPQLVESELFGHEKGAFTGADAARAGVFEQAHGGTLFLDEIGELPKDLQPKLLRVLEKREVRRVGGSKMRAVDVRVLSATNRNLRAQVQRSAFREDLYFRLAGASIRVPPLRDRMDDLPLLVDHFLTIERAPIQAREVPAHIWSLFDTYRWPGNVRELRNAVRRLAITPDRVLDEAVDGSHGMRPATAHEDLLSLPIARREAMDAFERSYLSRLLAKAEGNVSRAALLADVSRQMIQKLIRKYGRGGSTDS